MRSSKERPASLDRGLESVLDVSSISLPAAKMADRTSGGKVHIGDSSSCRSSLLPCFLCTRETILRDPGTMSVMFEQCMAQGARPHWDDVVVFLISKLIYRLMMRL